MDFNNEAFETILTSEENSLTVYGHGLDVQEVLNKLLLHHSKTLKTKETVIFILTNEIYSDCLNYLVSKDFNEEFYPKLINGKTLSKRRSELYKDGGCFFVTSRILIVDVLSDRIDFEKVKNLIVFDSHRVTETSIESFILKVFEERNPSGLITSLTDNPTSLTNNRQGLNSLLNQLHVKNIFLWPRSRDEVDLSLILFKPQVLELKINLTPEMRKIHSSLVYSIKTCLFELSKCKTNLDSTDLRLENALLIGFEGKIRNKIGQNWHKTSRKTKDLINDMRMLRRLLFLLLNTDSLYFYGFLLRLQKTYLNSNSPPLWLTSTSGNNIYNVAKDRVLKIVPRSSFTENELKLKLTKFSLFSDHSYEENESLHAMLDIKKRMLPVIENPPKWDEILFHLHSIKPKTQTTSDSGILSTTPGEVIIMLKDQLSLTQLRDVLTFGLPYVEDERYRWFITQQTQLVRSQLQVQLQGQLQRNNCVSKQGRGNSIVIDLVGEEPEMDDGENGFFGLGLKFKEIQKLSEENKLFLLQEKLLKEAKPPFSDMIENEFFSELYLERNEENWSLDNNSLENNIINISDDESLIDDINPKKRKIQLSFDETLLKSKKPKIESDSEESLGESEKNENGILYEDIEGEKEKDWVLWNGLKIHLVTASQINENRISFEKIEFVFLVGSDLAAMRKIEMNCKKLQKCLKLYLIIYENSLEEFQLIGSITKEKESFEELEKAIKSLSSPKTSSEKVSKPLGSNSLGFGRKLVVDSREFRSSLPALLHSHGFQVIPRTLLVGDYVLSPEICVERKGLSDLFQSFASGRLHKQVSSMVAHYRYPCLLIEFSSHKTFALVAKDEISANITNHAIYTKISILSLKFPSLRIFWSRSPMCTAAIFESIIKNQENVDVELATQIGAAPVALTKASKDEIEADIRLTAQKMLISLPGVDSSNLQEFYKIRENQGLESIAAISVQNEENLTPYVGEKNAKLLHKFLNRRS